LPRVSDEPTERVNVNVLLLNRVGFVDCVWKRRLVVTECSGSYFRDDGKCITETMGCECFVVGKSYIRDHEFRMKPYMLVVCEMKYP
jgi:hypothetical protein